MTIRSSHAFFQPLEHSTLRPSAYSFLMEETWEKELPYIFFRMQSVFQKKVCSQLTSRGIGIFIDEYSLFFIDVPLTPKTPKILLVEISIFFHRVDVFDCSAGSSGRKLPFQKSCEILDVF